MTKWWSDPVQRGLDRLMTRAMPLAEEIARHPATTLRFCKRLLRMAERADLHSTLDATAALQAKAR